MYCSGHTLFMIFTTAFILSSCGGEDFKIDPNKILVRDYSAQTLEPVTNCESQFDPSLANLESVCIQAAEVNQDEEWVARCRAERTRLDSSFKIYISEKISAAKHFRKLCIVTNLQSKRNETKTYDFCDQEFLSYLSEQMGTSCEIESMKLRSSTFNWNEPLSGI